MKTLLADIQQLCFYDRDDGETFESAFDRFARKTVETTLEKASTAVCGKLEVRAGFWVKEARQDRFQLFQKAKQLPNNELALYNKQAEALLALHLPLDSGYRARYRELTEEEDPPSWWRVHHQLAYWPDKERKEVWLLEEKQGDYDHGGKPIEEWPAIGLEATTITKKRLWSSTPFHSLLSVPVLLPSGHATRQLYGGIVFFTKVRDPFIARDFLMADCFVRMLSTAMTFKVKLPRIQ
jgi:hypothetical protein